MKTPRDDSRGAASRFGIQILDDVDLAGINQNVGDKRSNEETAIDQYDNIDDRITQRRYHDHKHQADKQNCSGDLSGKQSTGEDLLFLQQQTAGNQLKAFF